MKIGKPAIILLVLLLAGMVAVPSSATDVQNLNVTPVGNIMSDQLNEQQPNDLTHDFTLSGNYILWRGGEGGGGALYLYSRNENSTRTIATKISSGSSTPGIIEGYAVSDGRVVWSDGGSSLYVYDIASGKIRNIPDANTTGSQKTYSWNGIAGVQLWEPAVYGDRVVWLQGYPAGTGRNADVAFLNMTTNTMTLIDESPSAKGGLEISGDTVAWYAYDENVTGGGTHTRIFLYNLTARTKSVPGSGPGLRTQTALAGNYAGWTDFGNPLATPRPLSRIVLYTISSGTTRTIPPTDTNQDLAFITGDYAVYSECPGYIVADQSHGEESCNPKMYDIRTGKTWQLPSSLADQSIAGYSDGLILVEDTRGEVPALSLFRTDDLRPVATGTAAAQTPAPAETNGTSPGSTAVPASPTQSSPGFGFAGIAAALVVLCGIAGKSARPPRGRS